MVKRRLILRAISIQTLVVPFAQRYDMDGPISTSALPPEAACRIVD
jgi:hypothetical protein